MLGCHSRIFHFEAKCRPLNKFAQKKIYYIKNNGMKPSSLEMNVLNWKKKKTNCWFGIWSEMLKNEKGGEDRCYHYKTSSNYDSWLVKIFICSFIGGRIKLLPIFTHLPLLILNIWSTCLLCCMYWLNPKHMTNKINIKARICDSFNEKKDKESSNYRIAWSIPYLFTLTNKKIF